MWRAVPPFASATSAAVSPKDDPRVSTHPARASAGTCRSDPATYDVTSGPHCVDHSHHSDPSTNPTLNALTHHHSSPITTCLGSEERTPSPVKEDPRVSTHPARAPAGQVMSLSGYGPDALHIHTVHEHQVQGYLAYKKTHSPRTLQ